MKNIYLLLLITIILTACSEPNEDAFKFDLSTVYNQINFDQPTIDQVSKYIRFDGSKFGASNSSTDYSGDTLIITLTSKSGNSYSLQEYITPGSTVFSVSNSYIDGHDILKSSEWAVAGDSLRFISGETFLHWNSESAIALRVDEETPKATLRNWGTNSNTVSPYLAITTGRINDFDFDDLTVSYLDSTPGSIHPDIFEVISNRPFGIVRSSVFNADILSGSGWDLQLRD